VPKKSVKSIWFKYAAVKTADRLQKITEYTEDNQENRHRREDGIRMDFRNIGLGVWIGIDWLSIETGGELL
jgi:hypothetical protein